MAKTDPIVKSRRVFKDAADKARQKRLEGKNTPFQKALRAAEAAGKATFDFEGKPYAARTIGAAKQGYPSVGPPAIRAKRGPGSLAPPTAGRIPIPKVTPVIAPVKKRRNPGSFKIQPIHGGGALGPGGRRKRRN